MKLFVSVLAAVALAFLFEGFFLEQISVDGWILASASLVAAVLALLVLKDRPVSSVVIAIVAFVFGLALDGGNGAVMWCADLAAWAVCAGIAGAIVGAFVPQGGHGHGGH